MFHINQALVDQFRYFTIGIDYKSQGVISISVTEYMLDSTYPEDIAPFHQYLSKLSV